MGWTLTPTIGGRFICADQCRHIDCAANRKLIAAACTICNKPIGEDARYYAADVPDMYDHANCAELRSHLKFLSAHGESTNDD